MFVCVWRRERRSCYETNLLSSADRNEIVFERTEAGGDDICLVQ